MELLSLLNDERDGARLADLADRAGLSRSTAHALLTTLSDLGYVERDALRYTTGMRLANVGRPPMEAIGHLQERFAPALEAFWELCKEDCFLSIASGTHTYLIVDGVSRQGARSLPAGDPNRDALVTSAAGKIFLAHDDRLRRRVVRQRQLLPGLRADLERVRTVGYALDVESSRPGLNCVALPLRVRGKVVATISASGVPTRLGIAAMERTAHSAMAGLFNLLRH